MKPTQSSVGLGPSSEQEGDTQISSRKAMTEAVKAFTNAVYNQSNS